MATDAKTFYSKVIRQDQLDDKELIQTPELVLQIAIYKEAKMVKTKGVLVLASQTISQFVDAIDCTMDLALCWQDNWLE